MRRRDVLGGLAAVASLPSAVVAQTPVLPVIGFLSLVPEASLRDQLAAFRAGLEEAGYVIDRTVAVEYGWADGDSAKLPALAAELVNRLESAGLIERVRDPADRRRALLSLTLAGAAKLDEVAQVHFAKLQESRSAIINLFGQPGATP